MVPRRSTRPSADRRDSTSDTDSRVAPTSSHSRRYRCGHRVMRPSGGENIRVSKARERRDDALLDAERRQLAQFVEQRGPFGQELTDQGDRMLRLLANECTEPGRAQEECFTLFFGTRVGDVDPGGLQAFGSERFVFRRDGGHERPARAHAAAQDDTTARHGEYAISGSASLIDRKACGPCRSRGIWNERIALLVSQSGECAGIGFRHDFLHHLWGPPIRVAMSGPVLTFCGSACVLHAPHAR